MSEQDQITQERMFVTALFDLVDNYHDVTFKNVGDTLRIVINEVESNFSYVQSNQPGSRLIQAIAAAIPEKVVEK